MACKPSDRNRPTASVMSAANKAIADARKMVCDKCDRNNDGVCRTTAARKGKAKADIAHGVQRLSLACPLGKWDSVAVECPRCERQIVVDERIGVCKWCESKRTTGREFRIEYVPQMRPGNVVAFPFTEQPVRHLAFFLYPRYEESTAYHIEQLSKSVHLFNGKKICCVAIDRKTHHEKFGKELESLFDEIFFVKNDPAKREVAGFIPLIEKLKSKSPNEMICFAHGKGQQPHTNSTPLIKEWCDAMYDTCVRNVDSVQSAFEDGFLSAGSFKSVGNFSSTAYRWHYSGGVYWIRSQRLFAMKGWKTTCPHWWGAESYVGRLFHRDEGFCLFGDHIAGGTMYINDTWLRLRPALTDWKDDNERQANPVRNLGVETG